MERRMQLMEAADEIERGLFVIRCLRLEEKYQKKACRKEAVEAFEELFRLGVEQEKRASWLGISCLHTSLETGSHEVLLALYGDAFYFDPSPVERYWSPSGFADYFEEDMEAIMKRLRNRFPGIYRFEEAAVRRKCGEYYQAALCQLCTDLGKEIMETGAFGEMKKSHRFTAFFGQYRGEGEILWHTEGK